MLALIPPDDPERAHRRWPLERPAVWEAMKAAGSDLTSALPSHISRNAVRLGTVRDDFLTIVFWATAMRRAAVALSEMRALLRGRSRRDRSKTTRSSARHGAGWRRRSRRWSPTRSRSSAIPGTRSSSRPRQAPRPGCRRSSYRRPSRRASKPESSRRNGPCAGWSPRHPRGKGDRLDRRATPGLRATRHQPEARRAVWGRQLPVVEGPGREDLQRASSGRACSRQGAGRSPADHVLRARRPHRRSRRAAHAVGAKRVLDRQRRLPDLLRLGDWHPRDARRPAGRHRRTAAGT